MVLLLIFMHAFVLAGGFATRLWPLTEKRAKPLLPLAGKPILTHIIEKLPADLPITVSTNSAFVGGFARWEEDFPDRMIDIVIEETRKDEEKLGALGAVAQWIRQREITDDLLLLTGDNYFGFSFDDFLRAYRPGIPLLAAYDIGDRSRASAFGTVIVGEKACHPELVEGRHASENAMVRQAHHDTFSVISFEEKPKEPKTSLVSTGCSILPAATLAILTEFAKNHPDNVGGIFEELLCRGQPIDCFTFSEPWFDIGSFEAYLEATKALVDESVQIAEGAALHGTVCEGSVVIGKGSRVEGSQLRDCVLFEGCTIKDCVLERCILDNACTLTGIDLAGKMLREGTVLNRAA